VVPLSQSLREAVRDTLEHARVGLRRLSERALVAAAHTRRFALKLQRGYQKLSALGREHSRKLSALYSTVSAHSSVLGSQLGAALRDAKRRMRAQMRGVPPLPALGSGAPVGVMENGADDDQGGADELHFAWYKGFDDVTEDLLAGRVSPPPVVAAAQGSEQQQQQQQQQQRGQLPDRQSERAEDPPAPRPPGSVVAAGAAAVAADQEQSKAGDTQDDAAEPAEGESNLMPAYGWSAAL
jgi:hypothetical protein